MAADSVSYSLVLKPVTVGGTVDTIRYGYSGAGDTASFIQDDTGTVVGSTFVLAGGVVYSKNTSGGDRWSAPNVHGDILASTDGTGSKIGATQTYDPYGTPLATVVDITPGSLDYGWVGQHQRFTESATSIGYIEMGVRVYVPWLGSMSPGWAGSSNVTRSRAAPPTTTNTEQVTRSTASISTDVSAGKCGRESAAARQPIG